MNSKGTPGKRVVMSYVKGFLAVFGGILISKLSDGRNIFTWQKWKPVVISAAVAAILAVWKMADIRAESK